MSRLVSSAMMMLTAFLFFAMPLRAEPDRAAENTTRGILAKFDAGDPGWRVRMRALVELARQGPATVPVLIEKLKTASPSVREFAAQALTLFAQPNLKPALEQALEDPEAGVRMYAIQALSMLGPLERTERHDRMATHDPNRWGVRPMMAAALERDDRPSPSELRKALTDYDLRNLDTARIGERAPDIALTDFNGKTYRLSQLHGKTVVLRFILFDF